MAHTPLCPCNLKYLHSDSPLAFIRFLLICVNSLQNLYMQSYLQTYIFPVHALSMYKYRDKPSKHSIELAERRRYRQLREKPAFSWQIERNKTRPIDYSICWSVVWRSLQLKQHNTRWCEMLPVGVWVLNLPQGCEWLCRENKTPESFEYLCTEGKRFTLLSATDRMSWVVFCWCAQLIFRLSCDFYPTSLHQYTSHHSHAEYGLLYIKY